MTAVRVILTLSSPNGTDLGRVCVILSAARDLRFNPEIPRLARSPQDDTL